MRVVGGEFRGRKLAAPVGGTTRPTTDMVREAIFNSLRAMDVLDGAVVIDLFAGTGALGIEALSRGAARCTFVEKDPKALRTLRENIAALAIGERCAVVPADVMTIAPSLGSADIVFADPPYEFDQWEVLVGQLDAQFVVAESARPLVAPTGWVVRRVRQYGRTCVTVFAAAEGVR
jgi:16S rRNA (guanine966-N2)-methyltransferase